MISGVGQICQMWFKNGCLSLIMKQKPLIVDHSNFTQKKADEFSVILNKIWAFVLWIRNNLFQIEYVIFPLLLGILIFIWQILVCIYFFIENNFSKVKNK